MKKAGETQIKKFKMREDIKGLTWGKLYDKFAALQAPKTTEIGYGQEQGFKLFAE